MCPTVIHVLPLLNVTELINKAYEKAATLANGKNGFAACGIWPYNPDIFGDVDFLPSQLTEERVPADEQAAQSVPLPADQPVPVDQLYHPGPASQPMEGDAAVPDDNREKGFMHGP